MTAEELLNKWRMRVRQIEQMAVARLSKDEQLEFARLDAAIALMRGEVGTHRYEPIYRGLSRKEATEKLIDYLRAGPRKRREILNATGIPSGTLGTILNEKGPFRQRCHGTWELVEVVLA